MGSKTADCDSEGDAIYEFEQQLLRAQERLRRAWFDVRYGGGTEAWAEYREANQEVRRAERLVAASKGEEYAEPFRLPVKWDRGAPLPQLVRNDYRALLTFVVSMPDPDWDGTYIQIKSPKSEAAECLALVEFESCRSAKLGTPNDEVLSGHPLSGKGLHSYTAQRVVNSRWIKELQQINSVHRGYRASDWQELNHFVFWFHDSTFECVAKSFRVEVHELSFSEMLHLMVDRALA